MMNGETIGNKLSNRRAMAGLSMDELARKMGFSGQSSIQRYLAPDYNLELRPDMARKFDEALGSGLAGNSISERVQARLTELGKNPSGVALEAGLGRSAVRDIILTVGSPRVETLKKLTGPLQCSLEYLTAGTGQGIPVSSEAINPATVLQIALACGANTGAQLLKALDAAGLEITPKGRDFISSTALEDIASGKVGPRVAAARSEKNITQERVAELVDCHPVTIAKLESGAMVMTPGWLLRIARAIDVPVNSLLEKSDAIDNPVAYVMSVMNRRGIPSTRLAENCGISPSTLNRALNSPLHKSILSTRTLRKIKEWDAKQ